MSQTHRNLAYALADAVRRATEEAANAGAYRRLAEEQTQTIAAMRTDLEEAVANNRSLAGHVGEVQADRTDLREQLDAMEAELTVANATIAGHQANNFELDEANVELRQQLQERKAAMRTMAEERSAFRELNKRQEGIILERGRQIQEADAALAAEREARQQREVELAELRANPHKIWRVETGEGPWSVETGEGLPKWGPGLDRDALAKTWRERDGAGQPLELVSPWLHGHWSLVAILTPNPEDTNSGTADVVLRPTYGETEGVFIMGRIDRLQLDDARY